MTTKCQSQIVRHPFDCGLCDVKCTTADSFIAHCKNHKTFLRCNMCKKLFNSAKILTKHISRHHETLLLRCGTQNCNFEACYVYEFRNHIIACNRNGFICIYCNNIFNTPECLILIHWNLKISKEHYLLQKPVINGMLPVTTGPTLGLSKKADGTLWKPIPILPTPPLNPLTFGRPSNPVSMLPPAASSQHITLLAISAPNQSFPNQASLNNGFLFTKSGGISPACHVVKPSTFSIPQSASNAALGNAQVASTKQSGPISTCSSSHDMNRNVPFPVFHSGENNHMFANENNLPSRLHGVRLGNSTIELNESLIVGKFDPYIEKSRQKYLKAKAESRGLLLCPGKTQSKKTPSGSQQMAELSKEKGNSERTRNPVIKMEPIDGEIEEPNDGWKNFSDSSTASSSINTSVKPSLKLLENIKEETSNCPNQTTADEVSDSLGSVPKSHSSLCKAVDLGQNDYSVPFFSQFKDVKLEECSADSLTQMSASMRPEESQQTSRVLENGPIHSFSDGSMNASRAEADVCHDVFNNDSSNDSDNNLVIDEDMSELQSDLGMKPVNSPNLHKQQISAVESGVEHDRLRTNRVVSSLGTERRMGWMSSPLNIIREESLESLEEDDASMLQPSDESIMEVTENNNTCQVETDFKGEKEECEPQPGSKMLISTDRPSEPIPLENSRRILILHPVYLNKKQITDTFIPPTADNQSGLCQPSPMLFQVAATKVKATKTFIPANPSESSGDQAHPARDNPSVNAPFLSESNLTVRQILRKFKYQRQFSRLGKGKKKKTRNVKFNENSKIGQNVRSESCMIPKRNPEQAQGNHGPEIVKLCSTPSKNPSRVQNELTTITVISEETQNKKCHMELSSKDVFSPKKKDVQVANSNKTTSSSLDSLSCEFTKRPEVESTACKENPDEAQHKTFEVPSQSKAPEDDDKLSMNHSESPNKLSNVHKTLLNPTQIQLWPSQRTPGNLSEKSDSSRSLIQRPSLDIRSKLIPIPNRLLKHIPPPIQPLGIGHPKVSTAQPLPKARVGTIKFVPPASNLPVVWLPKDRKLPPVLFRLAPKNNLAPACQSKTTSQVTNTVSSVSYGDSNTNNQMCSYKKDSSKEGLELVSRDNSSNLEAVKSHGDNTTVKVESCDTDNLQNDRSHKDNGSVKTHVSEINSSAISKPKIKSEPIFEELVPNSQPAMVCPVELKSVVSCFSPPCNFPTGNNELGLNFAASGESLLNYLEEIADSNDGPTLVNSNMQYFKHLKQLKSSTTLKTMAESTDFFKCMSSTCPFTSNSPSDFTNHSKLHGDVDVQCSYCLMTFSNSTKLVEHSVHYHCKRIFQCSLCFYRACSKVHVASHLQACHKAQGAVLTGIPIRLHLSAPADDIKFHINVKTILCSFATCRFFTNSLTDMTYHMWRHYPWFEFPCFQCGFQCRSPLKWIAHLGLHDIFLLHCFYCSFGCNKRLLMLNHLTIKHADYPLMMYVRTSKHLLFTLECLLNANENVEFKYIQNCANTSHCYCYLFLYHAGDDGSRILKLLGNIKTKNMHFKSLECLYCLHKSKTTTSMEKHLKIEHCPVSQMQYYPCVSQPFSNTEIWSLFAVNHELLTNRLRNFLAYVKELKMCVMQYYFSVGQVTINSVGTYADLKILLPLPGSNEPSNICRRIILSFHNAFASRRKTLHFLCKYCQKRMKTLYGLRVHWRSVHVQRGKRFLYHIIHGRTRKHKSIKRGCGSSTIRPSNSSKRQQAPGACDLNVTKEKTSLITSSNLILGSCHVGNNSPLPSPRKRKFYSDPCDKRIFKKRKLSLAEAPCLSSTTTTTTCAPNDSPKCSLNACNKNVSSEHAEPQRNSSSNHFQIAKSSSRLYKEMSKLRTTVFIENYACLVNIPLRYVQHVFDFCPSVVIHNMKDDIVNDVKKYFKNIV